MNPQKHTPGPWVNAWDKIVDAEGKAICMVTYRKNGDNGALLTAAADALAIYRNIPAKQKAGVSIHSRGNESAVITDGRDGALVIVMPMRADASGTPQAALNWFHDTPEVSGMESAAA